MWSRFFKGIAQVYPIYKDCRCECCKQISRMQIANVCNLKLMIWKSVLHFRSLLLLMDDIKLESWSFFLWWKHPTLGSNPRSQMYASMVMRQCFQVKVCWWQLIRGQTMLKSKIYTRLRVHNRTFKKTLHQQKTENFATHLRNSHVNISSISVQSRKVPNKRVRYENIPTNKMLKTNSIKQNKSERNLHEMSL